ncbi:MAG: hypothetical protein JO076_15810 [Verrucomicrobia bacterium]|nr:hypothetical protein [Verrucomicrobiota bacterium]
MYDAFAFLLWQFRLIKMWNYLFVEASGMRTILTEYLGWRIRFYRGVAFSARGILGERRTAEQLLSHFHPIWCFAHLKRT